MTTTAHLITIHVRVDDPQALHAAALAHCTDRDGLRPQDAIDLIGERKDPDISACLIALFDPGHMCGCTIYGSSVDEA